MVRFGLSDLWYLATPHLRKVNLWGGWFLDAVLTAWVLFEHPVYSLWTLPVKLPALYYQIQWSNYRTKELFLTEYGRFLTLLASASASGKALPGAFQQAKEEFSGGCQSLLAALSGLERRLQLGLPLPGGLSAIAERYGLEEIKDLAQQLEHAQRYGQELSEALRRTSGWIGAQIQYKRQRLQAMNEIVLEFRLTSKMPLVVFGLIRWIYPDYLAPLSQTAGGLILTAGAVIAFEAGTVLFERARLYQLKFNRLT